MATERTIRRATKHDLPAIVQLLAQDKLGAQREQYQDPLPASYTKAFHAIAEDANQELVVMVGQADEVIATLQLSFI